MRAYTSNGLFVTRLFLKNQLDFRKRLLPFCPFATEWLIQDENGAEFLMISGSFGPTSAFYRWGTAHKHTHLRNFKVC